jgi:F-type H+-transporting ATPase subunit c
MKKMLSIVLLAIGALCIMSPFAFAADETSIGDGFKIIGACLGLGIAALGGALGQGRAAAAALEGIARNPGASGKIFTPFILALALIESLVIYALVLGFVVTG